MPGSDAVIGLPDEGTALEYDMDSYSQPVESAEQVRHRCGHERVCVVVLLLLAVDRAKRVINENAVCQAWVRARPSESVRQVWHNEPATEN